MPSVSYPLDAIRTDGWFEKIGEGIGSFQALCEIVGERFFAFSMITGARITSLTVDRREPDRTLVDFSVGESSPGGPAPEAQRLTLADFRRRLVGALLTDDESGPQPTGPTDVEGLQAHIGVRYLLLAPLYGYYLHGLLIGDGRSDLTVIRDGEEEHYDLETFRVRIRGHVHDELERVASRGRGSIDLARVPEAEAAARAGDHKKVVKLLGSWPSPLAILLRTPEGQMLAPEPRAVIAKGLGLLGGACVQLGDVTQAEEIFRLAIQYAQDGAAAPDIFLRMGTAELDDGRAGEAIGALRRAAALGADPKAIWPVLGRAFFDRNYYVAAFGCVREASAAGAPESALSDVSKKLEGVLGPEMARWRSVVAKGARR
jgi:hypothetical protein